MDPNSRVPREITYRIGWKRGRMIPHDPLEPLESGGPSEPPKTISPWERINRSAVWKTVPLGEGRFVLMAAAVLPALLFAMFLWMVYELARWA
ncbi:hypothetical protein O9H85_18525 [Paenibacillus filicis]|uniref:DUF5808 domain-containing protein n=1 Tax=Paenibacillus gyeongsangnamensis TaxID=3388067 RepID=A0ABT4QBX6_9BACL|nr:hypothetical protein [Paenibacillus filicis]MCZ8514380.1 hypothetical protein [Paenibacillus filicis]